MNCFEGADRLAKEWGVDNVKFRRHSLFRQSGKSSGKLAEARLIVLNATSSESGIANPGAHFLDEDFTGGSVVHRWVLTSSFHPIISFGSKNCSSAIFKTIYGREMH